MPFPPFLLCLILLPFSFPSLLVTPTSAQPVPLGQKAIFLLAGQSNMAGRGGVINDIWDGIVPSQAQPNPWILRLNARLQWVEAEEPIGSDIDTTHACGVGPGMPFARALLTSRAGMGPIGLVPCAVGGTNISQWGRGGYLYSQLVRRARASVKDGGTIQALVWYQGESDTVVRQNAEAYKRRLERFFGDVRADLQSPMLPIIQVVIGSGEGPYIEIVRQAQMDIDLLNLKTVDAMGLPLETDHLHLTTSAQVQLGEKLANAFLQFLPSQQVQTYNSGSNGLHISLFYTSLIVCMLITILIWKLY